MTIAASPDEPENNAQAPGYWMEQVQQRALDHVQGNQWNQVEFTKPKECAMALEALSRGLPLMQIERLTGITRHALRRLQWRNKETLESRRKEMARKYGQAAEAAMNVGIKKIEMLDDDDEMLAATSLKDIALSSAIFVDKAMQLSGMATVTIEHRKGPSIEDAQAAIMAARQKIADTARLTAIDV